MALLYSVIYNAMTNKFSNFKTTLFGLYQEMEKKTHKFLLMSYYASYSTLFLLFGTFSFQTLSITQTVLMK